MAVSAYTGRSIIDEVKTTTIPSYIRTGNTYWRKKEHQLNTIIKSFGLPQIFYTVTMAEGKWKHHWKRDEFQNRGAIHTHGIHMLKNR